MKICIAFLLLFFALCAAAQKKSATRYYTGGSDDGIFMPTEIVDEAEYAEDTTRNSDGTTTVILKTKSFGTIVRREQYKGNTPIGKWLQHYGSNPALETVYDVSTDGSLASCPTPYIWGLGSETLAFGGGAGAFTPPVIASEGNVSSFIQKNLRYPASARENNIQGVVRIKGTLTETGELTDLAISTSVDRDLDAEVFRVVKMMRFKGPALVDGRPARLCVNLPVTFKLD